MGRLYGREGCVIHPAAAVNEIPISFPGSLHRSRSGHTSGASLTTCRHSR